MLLSQYTNTEGGDGEKACCWGPGNIKQEQISASRYRKVVRYLQEQLGWRQAGGEGYNMSWCWRRKRHVVEVLLGWKRYTTWAIVDSNERIDLQQAETSPELGEWRESQQHHRLQVCWWLEREGEWRHTFNMVIMKWPGQWEGRGRRGRGGGGWVEVKTWQNFIQVRIL